MTNKTARSWNDIAFFLMLVALIAGVGGWKYITAILGPLAIGIWFRLMYEAWKRRKALQALERFVNAQKDLPEDAAKILRDNYWDLLK